MSQPAPVLVVDDDLDSRTLLELAVSECGHPVVTAANGAEALVLARRHHPSVILLDLAMPIMDGFAFRAEQLRDPGLAAIPVICVSGRYDACHVSQALRLQDCFAKPVDLEALVCRVRELAAHA